MKLFTEIIGQVINHELTRGLQGRQQGAVPRWAIKNEGLRYVSTGLTLQTWKLRPFSKSPNTCKSTNAPISHSCWPTWSFVISKFYARTPTPIT